mgnify:CR=1 FL=1
MNFGNCMIFFQTFVADCTEKVDLNMIELVCGYVSYYLPGWANQLFAGGFGNQIW